MVYNNEFARNPKRAIRYVFRNKCIVCRDIPVFHIRSLYSWWCRKVHSSLLLLGVFLIYITSKRLQSLPTLSIIFLSLNVHSSPYLQNSLNQGIRHFNIISKKKLVILFETKEELKLKILRHHNFDNPMFYVTFRLVNKEA